MGAPPRAATAHLLGRRGERVGSAIDHATGGVLGKEADDAHEAVRIPRRQVDGVGGLEARRDVLVDDRREQVGAGSRNADLERLTTTAQRVAILGERRDRDRRPRRQAGRQFERVRDGVALGVRHREERGVALGKAGRQRTVPHLGDAGGVEDGDFEVVGPADDHVGLRLHEGDARHIGIEGDGRGLVGSGVPRAVGDDGAHGDALAWADPGDGQLEGLGKGVRGDREGARITAHEGGVREDAGHDPLQGGIVLGVDRDLQGDAE
jgi:hypothetical protein